MSSDQGDRYSSGGAAVIERPPKTDNGGGGNDNGIGGRGYGGGGDGDGDGDPRRVTSEEKYAAKGMIAKECLLSMLSQDEIDKLRNDPFLEMRELIFIRSILDSSPYKAAFDLKTRKMHFYFYVVDYYEMGYEKVQFYNNVTSINPFDGYEPEEIYLNIDKDYCEANIMKECQENKLTTSSSIKTEKYYVFTPYQEIYDYVQ